MTVLLYHFFNLIYPIMPGRIQQWMEDWYIDRAR